VTLDSAAQITRWQIDLLPIYTEMDTPYTLPMGDGGTFWTEYWVEWNPRGGGMLGPPAWRQLWPHGTTRRTNILMAQFLHGNLDTAVRSTHIWTRPLSRADWIAMMTWYDRGPPETRSSTATLGQQFASY